MSRNRFFGLQISSGKGALALRVIQTPQKILFLNGKSTEVLDVMWKKILEKAVFPEKITGKKVAFFCRRILPIFSEKPVLPMFSKRYYYVTKKIEETVFPKKRVT